MKNTSAGNRKPLVKRLSTLTAILLSLSILTVLSTSFAQSGYYDDWGYWVDTSSYIDYGYDAIEYYDDWGNFISTGFDNTGYYDDWGNFISNSGFGDFGYVDTGFNDHEFRMQQLQTHAATNTANFEMRQAQSDARHGEFIKSIWD